MFNYLSPHLLFCPTTLGQFDVSWLSKYQYIVNIHSQTLDTVLCKRHSYHSSFLPQKQSLSIWFFWGSMPPETPSFIWSCMHTHLCNPLSPLKILNTSLSALVVVSSVIMMDQLFGTASVSCISLLPMSWSAVLSTEVITHVLKGVLSLHWSYPQYLVHSIKLLLECRVLYAVCKPLIKPPLQPTKLGVVFHLDPPQFIQVCLTCYSLLYSHYSTAAWVIQLQCLKSKNILWLYNILLSACL